MDRAPRHQCLIYSGSPSRHLTSIAAVIHDQLKANFRCLYLNSPPMVAGIGSYLAAAGIDVPYETAAGALVLSAERAHLIDGIFSPQRMLDTLEEAIAEALDDGYAGLWASGDMTWETGPHQDFASLLEYEWGLEEVFQKQPALCGICQYHADTLPHRIVCESVTSHPALFINHTLTRLNAQYLPRNTYRMDAPDRPQVTALLDQLFARELEK